MGTPTPVCRPRWLGAFLLLGLVGCLPPLGVGFHRGGPAGLMGVGGVGPHQPLNLAPGPSVDQAQTTGHTALENIHDQVSVLNQQLAAADDQSKILQARFQQIENKLQEKEKGLDTAGKETQSALDEVERARKDIEKYQQDLSRLRKQAETTSKREREDLQRVIKLLEQMLEWERMQPKQEEEGKLPLP